MAADNPKIPDPARDKKWVKCSECRGPVQVDRMTKGDVVCRSCSAPDWEGSCDVCGASPIVPQTGMCGPCTWGDADTVNGNW